MLHEHLQGDVVGKDLSRPRARPSAVRAARHVRRARVELGQQEPRLGPALVARDVPRDRVAVGEEVLGVRDGCLEQLLEVLIALLVVVAGLAPLGDRLAVEDEDVEEGVEQEDDVGLDRERVEQDGLGRGVECVRHERWLDHDERVVDVLGVQDVAVKDKA